MGSLMRSTFSIVLISIFKVCVPLMRLVCDCLLKVSGADDDSNFDMVEESPPVPDIASLKPSKEFRYSLFLY